MAQDARCNFSTCHDRALLSHTIFTQNASSNNQRTSVVTGFSLQERALHLNPDESLYSVYQIGELQARSWMVAGTLVSGCIFILTAS
jgi:hypothetical protein